jgi:flagellar biosynthesis/type III secretory pathway protein FliH
MTNKIVKGKGEAPKGTRYPDDASIIHRRVVDARAEAEAIVARAKAEAAKIEEGARLAAEEGKRSAEEAVKKGYAEGESKGLMKVTEKLIELERTKEKFYEGIEPDVVELAMAIAEKVIGVLAVENQKLVRDVVKQALEHTLGERVVIRMNPDDHRKVGDSDPAFRESLDKTKRIVFRSDESVALGGCIVESEVGTIDARLETQLSAIRKALGLSVK